MIGLLLTHQALRAIEVGTTTQGAIIRVKRKSYKAVLSLAKRGNRPKT